jgi:hypothetical protein
MALILRPVITGQPNDLAVPIGGAAQFDVAASGAAPLFYQWRFNNQIIRSATNAVLSLTNIQKNQAGSYSVLVRNAAGSTLSACANLKLTADSPAVP